MARTHRENACMNVFRMKRQQRRDGRREHKIASYYYIIRTRKTHAMQHKRSRRGHRPHPIGPHMHANALSTWVGAFVRGNRGTWKRECRR